MNSGLIGQRGRVLRIQSRENDPLTGRQKRAGASRPGARLALLLDKPWHHRLQQHLTLRFGIIYVRRDLGCGQKIIRRRF